MITNMFLFSFTLILFIAIGINGQNNNLNTAPWTSGESASLFGRLHQLIDKPQAVLSCNRVRANIKNAYPNDNTKYFICHDELRYEIFTCPNGGIFDNNEKACIDLCEQKKPCLNQGQCIILSNLTLQCVCRRDWTGERCETPLSSCASNPCGPNSECRMLKTKDYSQDYVCICNNHRTYGRNCLQTVPNPCLLNLQQFHPFAFSRHAYINCDDELVFFQPCNDKLYWNQEAKRCDRSLPFLLRSPFIDIKKPNQQQQQIRPNIGQPAQWQRVQDNQLQQNFPSLTQAVSMQQWSNQVPNNQMQTNQRFLSQSQPWQGSQPIPNRAFSTNTFIETTTVAPRIFSLKGFATTNSGQQNTQWQNNANNQIPQTGDFRTQSMTQPQSQQGLQSIMNQPLSQGQNQQTLTIGAAPQRSESVQQPLSQNNLDKFQFQTLNSKPVNPTTQFNNKNVAGQLQPNQLTTSFGTTTVANKNVPQGIFIGTLHGWQTNQQGSSNQVGQQNKT